MKKLMAAVTGLLTGMITQGADVVLAWDANPEPDIAQYRVKYGVASSVYTNIIAVNSAGITDTATNRVSGLEEGVTYFFVVTAVNTNLLESLPSNEVSYTVPLSPQPPEPPSPPTNLRLLTNIVQGAVSLDGPWFDVAIFVAPVETTNSSMFFRSVLYWEDSNL